MPDLSKQTPRFTPGTVVTSVGTGKVAGVVQGTRSVTVDRVTCRYVDVAQADGRIRPFPEHLLRD
jgi:hypothetical protein